MSQAERELLLAIAKTIGVLSAFLGNGGLVKYEDELIAAMGKVFREGQGR